jgi:hemolysin activation/secretion protein
MGGYATARGYDEYIANTDNALVLNAELRMPPTAVASRLGFSGIDDALVFNAFVDFGLGANRHPLDGEPSSQRLLGIGAGLRYTVSQYLTLRGDYGCALEDAPDGKSGRFHLGAMVSY